MPQTISQTRLAHLRQIVINPLIKSHFLIYTLLIFELLVTFYVGEQWIHQLFCKYKCSTYVFKSLGLKSTHYKKLAPNALQFTYQNLKSCKFHECFLFCFFMWFARFQILISEPQSIWRKLLVMSWLYIQTRLKLD